MSSKGKTWTLTPEQRANQSRAAKKRIEQGSNFWMTNEGKKRAATGRRHTQGANNVIAERCALTSCELPVTRGPGGWQVPTSIFCYSHRKMDLRAQSYGTTLLSVWDRWIELEGKCEICSTQLTFTGGGRASVMHMDHDHETGKFRGILCYRCNSALGYFRDDPEMLKRAARYLT